MSVVEQGKPVKRAPMTFDPSNSNADSDGHYFNVGRYSLYSHRTCREAREQLGLSNREVELLMWISSGLTKKQIAERMGVTSATVDTFRRRAYAKLGVSTGAAASAILAAFLAGTRVEAVKVGAPA